MQQQSKQKSHLVTVVLESGKERVVHVKASTPDVAGRRALKRTAGAVSIKKES